jgi:hypothetical protein
LNVLDELFWVTAQVLWSDWKSSLIVVTPDTVIRWRQAGFRFYWKLILRVRKPVGRKRLPKEVRDLIFRMVAENPTWGAPRIHGELVVLPAGCAKRREILNRLSAGSRIISVTTTKIELTSA